MQPDWFILMNSPSSFSLLYSAERGQGVNSWEKGEGEGAGGEFMGFLTPIINLLQSARSAGNKK